jgi:hypothetical protein
VPIDSTQHRRVVNVTPRRHDSALQQSSSTVHMPMTMEHVQALAVQSQLVHDPVVGPLEAPLMHVPVDAHQPHDAIDAQDVHVVAAAHGSLVEPHSDAIQLHCGSAHVPSVAPVELPVWQLPVLLHQPHTNELSRVHASQSVFIAQSSPIIVEPHSLGTQSQLSPVHIPSSDAELVPRLHWPELGHQPQL